MRISNARIFLGAALTLTIGLVLAQDAREVHFRGVIHDYSPSTISGGPYERSARGAG